MAPTMLPRSTFVAKTRTPDALRAFYIALHARASTTNSIFLSLTPLPTLLSTLSTLESTDPARNLPLHGVPYVIKDNIDAPPHPTTAGCPAFSYIPSAPAFVVEQLAAAGAVILGKVNMDQFASGLVGTRSPHGTAPNAFDTRYIPGGSSSGSAVAVAQGLCVFALATDTAGSGRVPAAMNGIVGVKPTKGLLSTTGVVPAAASLDCVAVFASNVADAELVLCVAASRSDTANVFTRVPPPEKSLVPDKNRQGAPSTFRIGLPEREDLSFCDDIVSERSYYAAVTLLQRMGGTTVDIDYSAFREAGALLYGGPFVAERYAAVGEVIQANKEKHPEDFNAVVAEIILSATSHKAWELYKAERKMHELVKRAKASVWDKIDILVLPTIPSPVTVEQVKKEPVKLNSMLGTYTNFVNLMDYCAVATPSPTADAESSVPRGVTFVAQAFEENLLLAIAEKFERCLSQAAGAGKMKESQITA